MLVQILVVTAHQAPGLTLFDSSLEGTEIELAQGTVGDDDIDVAAELLLLVEGIVLHAAGDTVALERLDVVDNHGRCQIRVFAHILEVTAVERRAVEVDAWTQQDVFLAVTGLLANAFAIDGGHLGVPGGSQTGEGREGSDGIVGPIGMTPVVPVDFHADAVRAIAGP